MACFGFCESVEMLDLMVILPRVIASKALVNKLKNTCCNNILSAFTSVDASQELSFIKATFFILALFSTKASVDSTTSFKLTGFSSISEKREKLRSSTTTLLARSAASLIILTCLRHFSSCSTIRASRESLLNIIIAKGFLISWATPADN